jgi:hypothetical protein
MVSDREYFRWEVQEVMNEWIVGFLLRLVEFSNQLTVASPPSMFWTTTTEFDKEESRTPCGQQFHSFILMGSLLVDRMGDLHASAPPHPTLS